MCGINFLLDKKAVSDKSVILKMNAAINHRGPDYSNFFECTIGENRLFFGANRLRIINQDKNSDQPMVINNGEDVLLFNGEIYNHENLRTRLSKKYIRFQTTSDTEVLLYHLKEYGAQGIKDLKGMFAFIYFNKEKRTITAARDKHGMKPLFYSIHSKGICLSSETRGILASELINNEIDGDSVNEYLAFRYIGHPGTIFKNIKQLKPGECLDYNIVTAQVKLLNDYREKEPERITGSFSIKKTEELLMESLSSQLIASRPVGLMLSGGVDSTLLLALARKHQLPLPQSYSVLVSKEDNSADSVDFYYAGMAARQYGPIEHKEIVVNSAILDRLPEFISRMDQPIGDSSSILTDMLCREAVNHCGVLISGAGGDEYFAGYNRHLAFYRYLRYPFILRSKPFLSRLFTFMMPGIEISCRNETRMIKKFFDNIDINPGVTYENFLRTHSLMSKEYPYQYFPGESTLNEAEWMKWALETDRNHYLVDDVLMLTDNASMKNGIEVRMPYLGDDLVNFVRGIQPGINFNKGKKAILKTILSELKGHSYTQRKKEGFGLPFGRWIRKEKHRHIINNLKLNNDPIYNYIDYNRVSELIDRHMFGKDDFSLEIFSLIVLSEWIKLN